MVRVAAIDDFLRQPDGPEYAIDHERSAGRPLRIGDFTPDEIHDPGPQLAGQGMQDPLTRSA